MKKDKLIDWKYSGEIPKGISHLIMIDIMNIKEKVELQEQKRAYQVFHPNELINIIFRQKEEIKNLQEKLEIFEKKIKDMPCYNLLKNF